MFRFSFILGAGLLALTGATLAMADAEDFLVGTETPGETNIIDPSEFLDMPQFVPVIGFMAPRQDFGSVEKGDELEHNFEFLNNGSAPLTIESARSETSGVSVGFSSAEIPAGETGRIYIRLKTEYLEPENFIRIYVTSNAHNGPSTLYVAVKLTETVSEE